MSKTWTLIRMVDDPFDLHVVPSWEPYHELSGVCDCAPRLDYQDPITAVRVYVHNAREDAN